jgi:hypothetical protein
MGGKGGMGGGAPDNTLYPAGQAGTQTPQAPIMSMAGGSIDPTTMATTPGQATFTSQAPIQGASVGGITPGQYQAATPQSTLATLAPYLKAGATATGPSGGLAKSLQTQPGGKQVQFNTPQMQMIAAPQAAPVMPQNPLLGGGMGGGFYGR